MDTDTFATSEQCNLMVVLALLGWAFKRFMYQKEGNPKYLFCPMKYMALLWTLKVSDTPFRLRLATHIMKRV